ncbi:MAG: hypothetical protein K2J12_07465 [Muribaculaceae bacterium]|nr:hypothetical protein [Muribaculaceae bacterium]
MGVGNWISSAAGGSVLGAGLGAVGSLVGGLIQNNENKKMMREQMAWQERQRVESQEFQRSERMGQSNFQRNERIAQNQFAEDMYNKYESPLAKVQQLKDAGLNPRLAMEGAGGSVAASSGSSGGAPSSGAPSAGSVSPPYQNIDAWSSGFQNMSNALLALAQAKKVGVETKPLAKMLEEQYRGMQLSNDVQELTKSITKVDLTVKEQTALQQAIAVLNDTNASADKKRAEIDNLEQLKLINKQIAETYKEKFTNEQENLKADTANKKADTILKGYISETEKTKPALNRVLTSLYSYQAETERVASEIANATQYSEVVAIRNKNFKLLEHVTAEIKKLNAEAESAIREKDYSTWDRINGSVGALGSLGFLFIIGKNMLKKVAPALSAPAGAFTPQFNNPADLNTYGQGTEIWH